MLVDESEATLERSGQLCTTEGPLKLDTLLLPCDLKDERSVKRMTENAIEKFGSIRFFVNCIGILPPHKKSLDISYEEFKDGAEASQRAVYPTVTRTLV